MSDNFPSNPKLVSLEEAMCKRDQLRRAGKSFGLTNGCFDLIHPGHMYFLSEAAKQVDELWVALNGDQSVRALKGTSRPIQSEQERAYALASLESVHCILIFNTKRLTEEIKVLKPDIYLKAGDYDPKNQNQEERKALLDSGSEIRFLPFLQGFSTTDVIAKIKSL